MSQYDKMPPRYALQEGSMTEAPDKGGWVRYEDLVRETRPSDFDDREYAYICDMVHLSGFELMLIDGNRRYGVVVRDKPRVLFCFDRITEIKGWLRGLSDGLGKFAKDANGKPVHIEPMEEAPAEPKPPTAPSAPAPVPVPSSTPVPVPVPVRSARPTTDVRGPEKA